MSNNSFTLDAIRAAADAKYGHTDIVVDEKTTVRLLNPLRLPKEKRDALLSIQDQLTADDTDQVAVFQEALRTVAEGSNVEILLSVVGDDLAVLAALFETYSDGTSAGEASASAA